MIITIAGNLGSGKSTVCGILKEKYNFTIYSTGKIQREYAEKMGISTLEMNKLMNTDPKYDHIIDDEVVRISDAATEPMIFDSRMAWHFVKKSLKVFLIINPNIAAERVYTTRDSLVEMYASREEAKNKLLERAKTENERYKQIYNVDNLKYSNYDVIIDTSYIGPDVVASIIYDEYLNREDGKPTTVYISPKNVYPTQTFGEISMEKTESYMGKDFMDLAPIQITYHQGFHYVIDGHHRLLASLIKKKDIILAELFDNTKYPFFANPENVSAQIRAVGISSVYDFENAGDFRYTDYPSCYGVE